MSIKIYQPVEHSKLRLKISPESLPEPTDVNSIAEIVSQQKQINALKMGLSIKSEGYNIFITGLTGSGRISLVQKMILELGEKSSVVTDKCYVNNFIDPTKPILLLFEKGKGVVFRRAMENFLKVLRKEIPKLFEGEIYRKRREAIIQKFEDKKQKLVKTFEELAEKENFVIWNEEDEDEISFPDLAYWFEEKLYLIEDVPNLVKEGKITKEQVKEINKSYLVLKSELELVSRKSKRLIREMLDEVSELDQKLGKNIVAELLTEIRNEFGKGNSKVKKYLDSVEKDVLQNIYLFDEKTDPDNPEVFIKRKDKEEDFKRYQINLIIDLSEDVSNFVMIERFPTFSNIFGSVEATTDLSGSTATSDFTQIHAGSLLQADGGILIMNAIDAFQEPGVWKNLKRVLMHRKLEIQNFNTFSQTYNSSLKPEPIDVRLKIILVGDNVLYSTLCEYDEDFTKLFKVKVQFEPEIPNDQKNLANYVNFVDKICKKESLAKFSKEAIAKIIEHGIRLSGNQKKITTDFSEIADLVREANYWTKQRKKRKVEARDVTKAASEKLSRHNLVEEKMKEMIYTNTILIDTENKKIGQVNALTVLEYSDHTFGMPAKISVSTSLGNAGIINIEREAELSGEIHDKGVLILTGFLRRTFAQKRPLNISASVCFEQAYSGIDGDSASSAELYALLSSIGEIPLRQDLAVTGSVNQFGKIQAVGGINEKVEGFFDVCKFKGLTGTQGVLLPKANLADLMLREDVVKACQEEKFFIFAIEDLSEGLEILTGIETGKLEEDGNFTPNSIFSRIDGNLLNFAKLSKEWESDNEEES
ncbi:AAA family ATPase [bacterium]|nr:AAA family ATPase [bacterium]